MSAPNTSSVPPSVRSRKSTRALALFAWPSPAQVGRWLERSEQVGDCLIWRGAPSPDGYAKVRYERKTIGLHRIAYAFWRGPIPAGCDVHHIENCTSRACWEPTHLACLESRAHRLLTLTVWGE